jgi:hypothetical protein
MRLQHIYVGTVQSLSLHLLMGQSQNKKNPMCVLKWCPGYLGGGIAAGMAIVARALMSDRQN